MIDVFISFSSRGGISLDWITSFRNHLKTAYKANYGTDEMEIWDMSRNGPGVNFENEISLALKNTMLLILVLDPTYDSVQVEDEIGKYKIERALAGEPVLIIKVIKRRGDKDAVLRSIVDSNLIVSYFSAINSRNTEQEYKEGSGAYNEEVEKIVKEIRVHKVEQRRKTNAQKLLARLAELKHTPKIYVAFGDAILTNNRLKFINQLNETIKHHKDLEINAFKVLPDDFTLTEFDHEELGELLCEENPYREACLNEMLNDCRIVIVPFQNDNLSEAEMFLKRIRYQLQQIRTKALDPVKKLPVQILQNVPEVFYQNSEFTREANNPAYAAYENITLVKTDTITNFIDQFMAYLSEMEQGVKPPPPPGERKIYIIEYNNLPQPEISAAQLAEEETNRANLWEYIASRNFTLIPKTDPDDDLNQAIQKHKEWLSISDGIIIYRGIREDDQWCRKQQSETFKAILELKRENVKKDLIRAVYIDPKQQNRLRGKYNFFKYEVIIDNLPELDAFLDKVRPEEATIDHPSG